jgi:hypothetical protein
MTGEATLAIASPATPTTPTRTPPMVDPPRLSRQCLASVTLRGMGLVTTISR